MAKRPTGSRRRDTSDAEDAFVARIVEFSTWSQKNTQVLVLFGIALVVVVVGIVYYVNYRQNLQVVAAQELETLHQVAASGDTETARLRFAQYLERFGGTAHAAEARLSLAQLHLQEGAPEEALRVLGESSVGLGDPIGPQLAVLQARAHEELGRFQEAEQLYLQVAERAQLDFQRIQALEDAARLRMTGGNPSGAVELYERILDEMPAQSPDRGAIQLRLGEARTAAATG